MALEKNDVVTLKYVLHTNDESGEKVFVEETSEENPMTFLYGVGMMIPKFEESIQNLSVGDKASFTIEPGEGYGEKNPDAVTQLPVDMFQGQELPPVGAVLPLSDNQGNNFQAIVLEVTPEAVIVDLNHPMAGKNLHFDVEILNTRPATEEELAHGHAHGADGHSGH
ncbi:FKBP-type peptidyl-prolyl cis-trans isomerase SlyD [Epilithonimonas bovis DSM 19482]|jgi:FKBP-type peptidyl-prolyl cis-trans isomerase SlyD|uniref:Peptidyl-prolyl cis-trans isomerase n=1 Tax=Epilithonimonas bovis DSM 19482 TaxID=1121284 RepID=A0A1U7PYH8_9FLAO|nr:peptidylprolyl isomerase [Epilithonimonas bovis]QIY82159.1 peptidylprolyl isomerase [Chryseobacterium sp. NEB161]SIT97564.1 FKBP-type peptidyl-prolyl cis-trans isomerase SlyD [Epilithonimonas bovis DSM 19482]HBR13059.1 peptidylprolyl isomerase [Chryseobacterium sp.]